MNVSQISRYELLRKAILPTTFIQAHQLSELMGCSVTLATETFQHTGSFKFRAAYNAALGLDSGHLIAASSGNFGQALALACRLLGKQCTIVMPETSAQVKIDSVRKHGAQVDLINTASISRAARVTELASMHSSAAVISAYDHELVIEGNSTLGDELASYAEPFDAIIAPIGGGGLIAGIIKGIESDNRNARVYGAEPLMANDAARSVREGRIVRNEQEPLSIADGARTLSLGICNWSVLQNGLAGVFEVPEDCIKSAVKTLFMSVNLKAEPTGALAFAALLQESRTFEGQKVCCIVSGGNVDPQLFAELILAN